MKIFSRHRDWDVPRVHRDVSASDLQHVELLLSQMSGPPLPDELRGEDAAVGAIAARIRITAASQPAVPGPVARSSRPAGRVVGIAVCVFGATTGAAFAGVLPAPAQQAAHDALAKVGVTVPKADAAASGSVSTASFSDGASSSNASLSRPAHTPGVTGRTKGTAGGATGETREATDSPGQGQGNAGGNGKGLAKGRNHAKNSHGQTTSAAHKNGGQAKGNGKPHPPQGGGKPAGAGGGKPAGAGGGKPAGAGGGKPEGAGGGKP